jgi:hypothetical protein
MKMATGVVSGQEVGFEIGGADTLVARPAVPDVESLARPAIDLYAFGMSGAIGVEVRCHAVLAARVPIAADRADGAPERAILEADGTPI